MRALTAVLTLILGWTGVSSVGEGVKVGALAGLLFFLGIDLTLYATTNVQNLTATLVDPTVVPPILNRRNARFRAG